MVAGMVQRRKKDMRAAIPPGAILNFDSVKNSNRWSYLADPLLRRGYNVNTGFGDAFASLFRLHNETMNIWIHLVGAVLFLTLFISWTWYLLSEDHYTKQLVEMEQNALMALSNAAQRAHDAYDAALARIPNNVEEAISHARNVYKDTVNQFIPDRHRFEDTIANVINRVSKELSENQLKETLQNSANHFIEHLEEVRSKVANELPPTWPILVFCFGGTMCLMASASYHLFVGIDKAMYDIFCRIDLAGISFMIFGSLVPPVVFTFHCYPTMITTYLILASVFCGATLFFCMLPSAALHNLIIPRTIAYVGAGSFIAIPFIDTIYRFGFDSPEMRIFTANGYMPYVGVLYTLGAAVFVLRVPEKWFPHGTFDIWLSSHQIWHISVFFAAYLHYLGCIEAYEIRLAISDRCEA